MPQGGDERQDPRVRCQDYSVEGKGVQQSSCGISGTRFTTQFTCFTSTKLQILTPEELLQTLTRISCDRGTSQLARD